MTIRSDEITMGNLNFVHGFSYHIIVMLLLYWLINKRILYICTNCTSLHRKGLCPFTKGTSRTVCLNDPVCSQGE